MNDRSVLVHCNAGREFGMGHLMRSLAIAEHAASRGWAVHIAGSLDDRAADVITSTLPEAVVTSASGDEVPALLRDVVDEHHPDVLHVDTYWLGDADLPPDVPVTTNMQDGSFGVLTTDLSIDANLGAEAGGEQLVPGRRYLLGLDGVAIRDQVLAQRGRQPEPDGRPRILVVLGGTDPTGHTAEVVAALTTFDVPLDVTVVVPDPDRITLDLSSTRHRFTAVGFQKDLPALAKRHDLVVSAAGSSVWDFACMGLPMAIIRVAENQVPYYDAIVRGGLALGLGAAGTGDIAASISQVEDAVSRPESLRELAERARHDQTLIDGLGTWRVVSAWEQLVRSASAPVKPIAELDVRPATQDDALMLLEWRNDPTTLASSGNTRPVEEEGHRRWLQTTLSDPDRLLLVLEEDGEALATIRWDRDGVDGWKSSTNLAPASRGRGLGTAALVAAERALPPERPVRLLGDIRETNIASVKMVERAGYILLRPADEDGMLNILKWLV